jgi:uncharacterized protein
MVCERPQASLQDLNSRLFSEQLPMNRFRPNIIVAGCAAFDEDGWEDVDVASVGGCAPVPLRCVRPCSRCKVRWIDPTAGAEYDG